MKPFRSAAVKATVILLFALCTEVTSRALEENEWSPLEIAAKPIQTSHVPEFGPQNPIVENLLINAIKSSAAMVSQIEGINKYAIMLNTAKKKKVDVQLLPLNRNILIESPILDPSTIQNEVDSILKKRQENSKKFMESLKNSNDTSVHECNCNKTVKADKDASIHRSLEQNVIHKTNDNLFQLQPEVRALNAFTKLTEFEQNYSERNSENASSNKIEKFAEKLPQTDTGISNSTINIKNDTTTVNKSKGVLVKVNKINISNTNQVRGAIKHDVSETAKSTTSISVTKDEEKENYPDPALFNKAVKTVSHRFQSHSIPSFLLEREMETDTEIPTSTIFEDSEITTLNPKDDFKSSKSLTAKVGGFLREDSVNSQFDLGNIKIVSSDKTSKKLDDSKQNESSTKGGTLRKVTKIIKQPVKTSESVKIIPTPFVDSVTEQTTAPSNGFLKTTSRIKSSTISPITYVKSSTSSYQEENSRHSIHAGFLNISDTNLEINVQNNNKFNSQSKNENENNLHKESLVRESSERFRLQKIENKNTTPAPKISTKIIVNPVTFDIKSKGVDRNTNNSLIYDRGTKKYVLSKFETISPFISDSHVRQIYSEIGSPVNLPPNPELDRERGPFKHINFTRQNKEIVENEGNSIRINHTNINRNPGAFRTKQESFSNTGFEYSSRIPESSNIANRGNNPRVTPSDTIGSTSNFASSSRTTGRFNQSSNFASIDSTNSNSNQNLGSTTSYTSTGQFNSKPNYINSDSMRNVNSNRGNNRGYNSSDSDKENVSTTRFTTSRTPAQFSAKYNDGNSGSLENINTNTRNKINQISTNQGSGYTFGFGSFSGASGQFNTKENESNLASGSTFETPSRGTSQFNIKANDINSSNIGGTSDGQISSDSNQTSGSAFGTTLRGTGQFDTKLNGISSENTNTGINGVQISSNGNQASVTAFGTSSIGTGQFNTKLNGISSENKGSVNLNENINGGKISLDTNRGSAFVTSPATTGQYNTNANRGRFSTNSNQFESTASLESSTKTTGQFGSKSNDFNSSSVHTNVNTNRGQGFASSNLNKDFGTTSSGSSSLKTTGLLDSNINRDSISSDINQESATISSFASSSRTTGQLDSQLNDVNSAGTKYVNTNRGSKQGVISSNTNQEFKHASGFESTVQNINKGHVSSDTNRSKPIQTNYNFELNSNSGTDQNTNKFNITSIESANNDIFNTKLNPQTTQGSQGSYVAKNQANIGQSGFVTPPNSILGFASTSGPDSNKFEITTKSNSYSDGSINGIASSSLQSGNSRITTRPYFNPGESGFGIITQAGKSATSDNDDINKNASSSFGTNVHQYNLELGNKHRGDDYTQNLNQKDNSNEADFRLSKTKVNSNNAVGIDDSVLINVPSSIRGGVRAGSSNTRNVNGQSGFSSIPSENTNGNIPKINDASLQNKFKNTNNGVLINNGLLSNTNLRKENSSIHSTSQQGKDHRSSLDLQHGASSNDKLASSFISTQQEPFSLSDDKERGSKKFTPSKFDTISPYLTDSNINKLYGDSQRPRLESNGKSNTIEFDDGKLTVGQEYGNGGIATSTKTQYRGSIKYHPSFVDWNYDDNDFPSQFSYNYNTHTGISAFQKGVLKEINKQKVFVIRGSYQYTAPDGSPVVVNYTADENGFHPEVVTPLPNYEKELKSEVFQEFEETTEELETTNNY